MLRCHNPADGRFQDEVILGLAALDDGIDLCGQQVPEAQLLAGGTGDGAVRVGPVRGDEFALSGE